MAGIFFCLVLTVNSTGSSCYRSPLLISLTVQHHLRAWRVAVQICTEMCTPKAQTLLLLPTHHLELALSNIKTLFSDPV